MSPSSQSVPPPQPSNNTVVTEFLDIHPDVLLTHILTRLDGQTLASANSASSVINSISSTDSHLWYNLCESTWKSVTTTPRIRDVVSSFPPRGPRSFFSSSFPLLEQAQLQSSPSPLLKLSQLISAVDIHYRNELLFSKAQETETETNWFRCSPFRIDLLDPKEVIATSIPYSETESTSQTLSSDLTISWILIDPLKKRAVNLSSHNPVSVQRHWLSGEIQLRYSLILTVDKKQFVQCGIVITCGGSERGEMMHIREVSLQMEDMDGMYLNGKDTLVILRGALEGKKGRGAKNVENVKKKYRDFLEMKKERKEAKARVERRLDYLCMIFGVTIFVSFLFYICCT